MLPALKITAGFVLDIILGDPYGFPHPVKLMGKLILFLEKKLIKMGSQKTAGIILVLIVTSSSYITAHLISSLSLILEILLIYTILAVKSLSVEARRVYTLLENNKIDEAKKHLSTLVSRDTDKLDEEEILKATIETVAENVVDAVVSPIFYLFIGGAPLAMTYKAVSTIDSMIGYKNDKYINFGMAGAKLDDIMNFLPARISAFFLIPAAAFFCGMDHKNSLKTARRDRLNHSSPNSAHPEAAFAGALNCRLGGDAVYFGNTVKKPVIGRSETTLIKNDILRSIKLTYATAITALITGLTISFTINSVL